jgi:hypothetical protein
MVPSELASKAKFLLTDVRHINERAMVREFFAIPMPITNYDELKNWLMMQELFLGWGSSFVSLGIDICHWQGQPAKEEDLERLAQPLLTGQAPTDHARWHAELAALDWPQAKSDRQPEFSDEDRQRLLDSAWNLMESLAGEGKPPKPLGLPEHHFLEQALASVRRWAREQEASQARNVQLPPSTAGADDPFITFQRKQRKLLTALQNKGSVPIADVYQAVYGGKFKPREHQDKLDQLKKRTNRKLAQNGVRYEVKRQGESMILSPV